MYLKTRNINYKKTTTPYPVTKRTIHLLGNKTSPIPQMGHPKCHPSTLTILTPTKIKLLNMVIQPGKEYVFHATTFSIPSICKMDEFLIKLINSVYNLPTSTPNIFIQLPREAFTMETYSLLPRHTTTLSKQLTQTLNGPKTAQTNIPRISQIHHLPYKKSSNTSRS